MNAPLVTENLSKHFDQHVALRSLTLAIPAGRIVGLLGRNGAGKTTLLHLASGLLLPTSGSCTTLNRPAGKLGAVELAQLGFVAQSARFVDWMTVAQQLYFHSSFFAHWDQVREQRLLEELELDRDRKIIELSPGDQQKLGLILAVCHHPRLLLLDEPMSALDPIVRARLISFLVGLVQEDSSTIVVSSHTLNDVEKMVDWLVCLDRGELALSAPFDEVQETYAEWIVTSSAGTLPTRFAEPWILAQEGNERQTRLLVRIGDDAMTADQFAAIQCATVTRQPMSLEQLFPLLIKERKVAA
jgi:ABC-2 type transport system ATP-binding protein